MKQNTKKKLNYIGRMVATRAKTRRERYDDKKRNANTYPISLCCVNFQHDGNLGFLIRRAACFGAKLLHVIVYSLLFFEHLDRQQHK